MSTENRSWRTSALNDQPKPLQRNCQRQLRAPQAAASSPPARPAPRCAACDSLV